MISCTIQIIFFFSPYASKFMLVSVHSKKFLNYFSRISFFLSLHEVVHIALFLSSCQRSVETLENMKMHCRVSRFRLVSYFTKPKGDAVQKRRHSLGRVSCFVGLSVLFGVGNG